MDENCTHDCSSCGENCSSRKPESLLAPANGFSNVKKVIAVVSGKGGVGKSMVTSLLAGAMRRAGCKTAILDADITGPSIPKMFGLDGERAVADEHGIVPAESGGTKIMSINLMLEHSSDPVIWRGPVIAGAVKQFWSDVAWGDVDCMFVDMPPGTGDVALTVFQSLPVDGLVIVTSPQQLVGMIVEKAVNMAKLMNVPVIGLVENMAWFKCPDCGKEHFIFGDSHIEQIAGEYGIGATARIPMDPAMAEACDAGRAGDVAGAWLDEIVSAIKEI
ncbi:MAG: Mrp/NBP35 family ATP-binding protein [Butyricicoccus sp.]|nr:Mrp/NBP35 family ATP-binding protein [Butyricicoccus sp.]